MNISYIVILIPLPAKHQTISNRLLQVREHIYEMVVRFSDKQISPTYSGAIIGIFILALVVSSLLNVSGELITNILLVSGSQLLNRPVHT